MTNHDGLSAKIAADEALLQMTTHGDAELDHKHGEEQHPLEGLDSESLASFNLRRIRKELGFSQQQIADRIKAEMPGGVRLSQTQIAKIERGERPWRLNEMVAISDALGIRWDEFFRVTPNADYSQLDVEAARLRYERTKALEEDARDLWRQAARNQYEAEEDFVRTAAKHGIEDPHAIFALQNRWFHQEYVKDALEGPDLDHESLDERRKEAEEFARHEWARFLVEAADSEAADGNEQ